MEINFCYINGISRENTPYFSSLSEQISYFTSLTATKVITNTFYPPYYRNNIKVDTADIDLDDNYNYVYFEYNNKYYFYFISNISYISEDVLSVSITMDTIQTYFFDITLHSAVIRRRFIDRYTNLATPPRPNLINRNYIRENVSIGTLGTHNIIDMSTDDKYDDSSSSLIKGWYFIIQSNDRNNKTYTFINTYKDAYLPYYIQAVPYFGEGSIDKGYKLMTLKIAGSDTKYEYDNVSSLATIAREGALPNTVSIVFINRDILAPYVYAEQDSDGVITIKFKQTEHISTWTDTNDSTGAVIISSTFTPSTDTKANFYNKLNIFSKYNKEFKKDITTRFGTINREKNKPFSIDYVPCLLDENYYRFSYGDGRSQTEYPLHLLPTPNLSIKTYFDFLGYTYYSIYGSETNNVYNTTVSIQPNTIDLIVSGANSYDAYSKWSIAGALLSTTIGVGASLLTMNPIPAIGSKAASAVSGAATAASAASTLFSPKGVTSYVGSDLGDKRLKYNYKLAPWVGMNSGDIDIGNYKTTTPPNEGISIPGSALHSFTTLTSALTTKANAYSSPGNVKQYNALLQNKATNNLFTRIEETFVTDIDACAQYYHRYGYLVNEYISSTSTIFSDINTRYYFNYIELAECDVELSCLQFDSCINDISTRFKSGLRLWNPTITTTSSGTSITYDIGNYTYDNVERSAING